jgi:hypothetical protein
VFATARDELIKEKYEKGKERWLDKKRRNRALVRQEKEE